MEEVSNITYSSKANVKLMNPSRELSEVLCAIWFEPPTNEWDSTFFGKYYEEVLKHGFTEKQELKQVEFQIKQGIDPPEVKEVEGRMVFKNPQKRCAITLAKNFISFHQLTPFLIPQAK